MVFLAYLGVDGDELGLGLQLELPHPDEVLVNLGEALLAAVLQVLREELELLRNAFQSFGVVTRQLRRGSSSVSQKRRRRRHRRQ